MQHLCRCAAQPEVLGRHEAGLELDQISGAQGTQGGNIPGLPPINYVTLYAVPVSVNPQPLVC